MSKESKWMWVPLRILAKMDYRTWERLEKDTMTAWNGCTAYSSDWGMKRVRRTPENEATVAMLHMAGGR